MIGTKEYIRVVQCSVGYGYFCSDSGSDSYVCSSQAPPADCTNVGMGLSGDCDDPSKKKMICLYNSDAREGAMMCG